ncbi:hypothetical protein [Dyella telluris]|uniref:Uncharacterized protein n=1 Tax=Dyella telluris TaxID=2763498 RepID=A0A7G8Q1L8_9GAMM|nr:hypothetical protein [Dyella telluris]QNK00676.1 hypothetical protein H8F01_16500 [Dyella telluris]
MQPKPEVWDRVMEYANLLAKEDQPDTYRVNYDAFKDYCESQRRDGYDHPFLWETLADFTIDDAAAIPLYQHALEGATGDDMRPYRVSMRFALAQRYKNQGDTTLARQYAIEADDEARDTDDRELRRRISRFLLARD